MKNERLKELKENEKGEIYFEGSKPGVMTVWEEMACYFRLFYIKEMRKSEREEVRIWADKEYEKFMTYWRKRELECYGGKSPYPME